MNERIEKIAKEHGFIHEFMSPGEKNDALKKYEKFAELIVEKCAQAAEEYWSDAQIGREWVGLTDEDIKEGADLSRLYKDQFEPVARWAESILKEKNT
jgi:hypothetical protein